MDFFDLLFGGGEAVHVIFGLGFIPKEEDFREFSDMEYQVFKEKECDICGKMYTFKSGIVEDSNDLYAFSEEEKQMILKGGEILNSICDEKKFLNDDMLKYAAKQLPDVFSKGTKYEIYGESCPEL